MGLLKREQGNIHYELSGKGEAVVLIQGVGVTGEGWRLQVRELEKTFQTLTFDNRGLARSSSVQGPITIEAMAQDAQALMDEAGWSSAHVVGHSMGGVIAQQLALDCPERVRSLSLLCTFARGKDALRVTPWILWMTLRTRIGSRRARRRAFLAMLFPKTYLNQKDSDELAREVGEIIGRDLADQPPVMMKQVLALGRHDVSHRLRDLEKIPSLVISAPHDRIALPSSGRRLAKLILGACYEEISDSSHGVIIQKAGEVNRRLKEFIASIKTAGGSQP